MKGIIYKICFGREACLGETEWLYVGSTIDKLYNRQGDHNYDYRTGRNRKLYEKARENNIGKLECILLEEIEFQELEELRIKEEEYRVKLKANLNEIACYRSEEDRKNYQNKYNEENKEQIREYYKEYNEENKDIISQQKKEYYEKNKDKIIERQKHYIQINNDIIREKRKIYIENNKAKLKEQFNCKCGGKYTYQYKSTHIKTKKHQTYLQNNN
jgi:hypothetical protein